MTQITDLSTRRTWVSRSTDGFWLTLRISLRSGMCGKMLSPTSTSGMIRTSRCSPKTEVYYMIAYTAAYLIWLLIATSQL